MKSNVAIREEDARDYLTAECGQHATIDSENRVEELRHYGLRPEDAERVEAAERTLDLPEEQAELGRIRAAAVLHSSPKARKQTIAQIVHHAVCHEITAYEALCRLKDLEIAPDEPCPYSRGDWRRRGDGEIRLQAGKRGVGRMPLSLRLPPSAGSS
jgi:hypothetical protein